MEPNSLKVEIRVLKHQLELTVYENRMGIFSMVRECESETDANLKLQLLKTSLVGICSIFGKG